MPKPTNNLVSPLLNDLYQITMAHAYFVSHKHEEPAVFELFFRKNPFGGEYVVFAGLEECIRHLETFHFSEDDISYLQSTLPNCQPGFFEYLRNISTDNVRVNALPEGCLVFPMVPMIQVEGPLAVLQLLETTFLNLVNFPSLVATNATRHRFSAGSNKQLIEFGLRRAQGPDGGVTASRYSFLGGFDGTSNTLAGKLFGIPIRGTHAHAFVSSFTEAEDVKGLEGFVDAQGKPVENYWNLILECQQELGFTNTHPGELKAFSVYARAFPTSALMLVDTYDTMASGVPNFLIVALALHRLGYRAVGIRLDSGDLAYLSTASRALFKSVSEKMKIDYFKSFQIVASNDLNVGTIDSLNQQGHEIDVFGIGTHLVTCQSQPALGCVYKLVELNDTPRIKLSQEIAKVNLPGKKAVYRLWGSATHPVVDLMVCSEESEPKAGDRLLCRHPFIEHKRVYVNVTKVERLHFVCFENGKRTKPEGSLVEQREYVLAQLKGMRSDHLRNLNATPYKVSVSEKLYNLLHSLWLDSTPVTEI